MSDTPNTDAMPDYWDGHNVLAVSFEDDHTAYKALTLLKELDSQHRISVQEAVVAYRDEDGQVVAKDRVESSVPPATAGGGLLGLLLGIIGGPLGMLVGGTYGLFVGSLFDIYDAGETDSALAEISNSVKPGETALLAVVNEQSPEVIDAAMTDIGGTVVRRAVDEVEAEIAAAEEAERRAKHEARKELHRGRRDRDKASVDAKVAELKAKLHHGQKDGADTVPAGSGS